MNLHLDKQNLIDLAIERGARRAAVIDVERIRFRREFRVDCERNACGHYGACWMCPPDVGDIDDMIERAKTYENALIFQYIGSLEDSYDIDGMNEAAKIHSGIVQALAPDMEAVFGRILKLGAGACNICERCSRLDGVPCLFPDKAVASLESYGIAVSELARLCGMNYINGQDTVTYFGGILFDWPK